MSLIYNRGVSSQNINKMNGWNFVKNGFILILLIALIMVVNDKGCAPEDFKVSQVEKTETVKEPKKVIFIEQPPMKNVAIVSWYGGIQIPVKKGDTLMTWEKEPLALIDTVANDTSLRKGEQIMRFDRNVGMGIYRIKSRETLLGNYGMNTMLNSLSTYINVLQINGNEVWCEIHNDDCVPFFFDLISNNEVFLESHDSVRLKVNYVDFGENDRYLKSCHLRMTFVVDDENFHTGALLGKIKMIVE